MLTTSDSAWPRDIWVDSLWHVDGTPSPVLRVSAPARFGGLTAAVLEEMIRLRSSPTMKGPSSAEVRELLATRRERTWCDLVDRYGSTFDFRGIRMTADAELVRELMQRPDHTRRRARWYKLASVAVPGLDGVVFLDGERWRQSARAITPSFKRGRVDGFASFIQQATRRHATRWAAGTGEVDDLREAVRLLGAEIVLHVGYGLRPDDPLGRDLGAALTAWRASTEDAASRLDDPLPGLGRIVHFGLHRPVIARRWADAKRVVERVLRSGDRIDPEGWLGRLSAAGLDSSRIASEATDLWWAYDAVHFALSAALFELSRQPSWWTRVRAEIDEVTGNDDDFAPARLSTLPVLDAVVREVLRQYPVSMGIGRRVGAPLPTSIGVLPADREVLVLLFALHHHPRYWDCPFEFRPERWMTGGAEQVPYSYVPFLRGPRKCSGRNLGELLLRAALATMVQGFELEAHISAAPLTTTMVPRFAGAIPVRVRERTKDLPVSSAGREGTS